MGGRVKTDGWVRRVISRRMDGRVISRRMSPGRYSAAADKFSAEAEDAGCEDGLSPDSVPRADPPKE